MLKYKKDAKLTDRITRLSRHSVQKKLSRIGRKMIGTQVFTAEWCFLTTNAYAYFHFLSISVFSDGAIG